MRSFSLPPFFLMLVALGLPGPAKAQNTALPPQGTSPAPSEPHAEHPARIGNRANGFSYQPTQNDVLAREKAAGIAPSAQHQRALQKDVDQLDRELMEDENNDPALHPQRGK